MHPCRAPGPDDMHVVFHPKFLHIVGDDIAAMVLGIVQGTRTSDGLNTTNVTLIPKVKTPTPVYEFRPIISLFQK